MSGVQVRWDSPVAAVGGKNYNKIVKATGVETVGDLLGIYPRRYVRKGSLSELEELNEGDILSLVGEVVSSVQKPYQDRRTHRTAYRLEVRVRAQDGSLLLTYFDKHKNTAEWRANQELPVGSVGVFSGRLKWFNNQWQLTNPASRMYGGKGSDLAEMPDLIPLYASVAGVNTWQFEDTIRLALDLVGDIPELLPAQVREAEDLIEVDQALRWIHRPDNWGQKVSAEKRLKYDEAFVAQTVLARRRAAIEATVANPRPGAPGGILDRFDERLPFALTDGQRSVGEEIAGELGEGHPMHRLLQGEVGSGKTVVALRAMLQVVDSGGQAALLAPTEVLAQQHERSITAMLGDLAQGGLLGGAEGGTRVALLTGSLNAAARRQALAEAAGGEAGIVIGTHALLEERVQFADLGLVVVDEQHRFGVEQRAALNAKAGSPPHVLVMTATPIPRTVAMTVFGDLDTSTLVELPAGRGEVQTTVVPTLARPEWLNRAWERVREEVAQGRQAYVVCARIDPDEGSADQPNARPLRAVEELAPQLAEVELAGAAGGDAARPDAAGGEGPHDAGLRPGRGAGPRLDDRHRGRRRRAQRNRDGDPRRRPVRRLPAPPAARPDRARRPRRAVPPGQRGRPRQLLDGATHCGGRDPGRVRALQDRPRATSRGQRPRHRAERRAVRAQAALGAPRRGRHRARPCRGDGTPRRRSGPGRQPRAGGGCSPARGVRAGRVPGQDMTTHPVRGAR